MSRAAQAVATAVREMREARERDERRKPQGRKRMDGDESEDRGMAEPEGLPEAEPDTAATTTVEGEGGDVAKKKKAAPAPARERKRKIAKTVARKPRAPRGKKTEADKAVESTKRYKVVGAFPDVPKEGTFGRKVLEVIKDAGKATVEDLRKGLPKDCDDTTMRKYLKRFVDAGNVVVVGGDE